MYYCSTYRHSSVLKSKAKAALLNQLWMWIVGLVSTGDLKAEAGTNNLCSLLAFSEQEAGLRDWDMGIFALSVWRSLSCSQLSNSRRRRKCS